MSLGVLRNLIPINCFYNNKPNKNGRCYSSECMMNQDKKIAKEIASKGCTIYKNIKKEGNRMYLSEVK